MANETPNVHDEFLTFANGISTASAVFAESMNKLNTVYLDFCDHLLQSASATNKKVTTLEKEVSELKDSLDIATEKVKSDSTAVADKTTKEAELTKLLANAEDNGSYTAPYNELSEQMLNDLKIMISNFLYSQNQMYTSAAAATNTGILKIYKSTTSSDSKNSK